MLVEIERDEDKAFEVSVLIVIKQLRADAAKYRVQIFPAELNCRTRRIVHELGEKHHLHHLSVGGEKSKKIMLWVICVTNLRVLQQSILSGSLISCGSFFS